MIGHFPIPYPDELFYSICARFSDRVQYRTTSAVIEELFGTTQASAIVGLPSHLGRLVTQLPRGYPVTLEDFIEQHTLLPFYASFLPTVNLDRLQTDMRTANAKGMQGRASATVGSIRTPDRLQFCPLCIEADREQFGECYWHRIHQVAGVMVCPIHAVWLEQSEARIRHRKSTKEFISAERAVRAMPPRALDLSDACHPILLTLARDADWLLHQHNPPSELETVQKRYMAALVQRKLATPRGTVHVLQVWRAFRAYYPADLFQWLRCDLDERVYLEWLSHLVHNAQRIYHPMYHLLMIHFLGYALQEFLCGEVPTEYCPFGEKPWPCLNPASEHYRQPVVHECQWANYPNNRGLVGTFTCLLCGFVYLRRGPDQSPEDRFRRQYVRTYGPVWEAELRRLWSAPNIGLRRIARQLGVGYHLARDYAARLGLPVPRPGNPHSHISPTSARLPSPASPPPLQVEEYRARWLTHLKKHPNASRKELTDANQSVSRWLRRYDPEWLELNLPARRIPHPRPRQANWEARDRLLVVEVEQAATGIRNLPGRPVQVTKTAISREVGQPTWLQDYLAALPLTSAVLEQVTETDEEFAVRRVEWAAEQFQQEHIAPTRTALTQRTGIVKLVKHPQVKMALETALQRLHAWGTTTESPDA